MRYQQTFLFPLEAPAGDAVPSKPLRKRRSAGAAIASRRGLAPQPLFAPRPPIAPPPSHSPRPATAPVAPSPPESPLTRLDNLRQMVRRMESRQTAAEASEPLIFSAGGAVLDALLPHGGLRPGTLVEWVCDARRSGATLLAMIAAAEVLAHPASAARPLVIADGWGADTGAAREAFYPPAAVALGIASERMVIFRRQPHHTRADLIWAIDQALRSGAVAAVFAEIGDWLDPADARRLQLAAEIGGAIGLLVRPTTLAASTNASKTTATPPPAALAATLAKTRASFADVRWLVSPLPGHGGRRLQVELARCRGGVAGSSRLVEIDSRPDLLGVGAGGRDRVVAVRDGGANDAAAAMASDLVGRLADSASAVRRDDRRARSRPRRAS